MNSPTAVVNLRREPYDVYIGRASRGHDGYLGNPFRVGPDGSREDVLQKFREYFYARLERDPEYHRRVEALRGKRLGCFCAPLACHGHLIAEYLNQAL